MDKLQLKLSEPIKHIDEEIKVLEFREPTADDAIKLGYPAVFGANGEPIFNAKTVYAYLSELTALPPSTVKKVAFCDVEKFKYFLSTFFMGSRKQALELLKSFSI